jgi:hypothetical protein
VAVAQESELARDLVLKAARLPAVGNDLQKPTDVDQVSFEQDRHSNKQEMGVWTHTNSVPNIAESHD